MFLNEVSLSWKECPEDADIWVKYSVDKKNPRIATKTANYESYSTIIGSTPLPLSAMTSWSIKVLKSKGNNGNGISVGVAPSDVSPNVNYDWMKCGWNLECYELALYSKSPQKKKMCGRGKKTARGKKTGNTYAQEIALVL